MEHVQYIHTYTYYIYHLSIVSHELEYGNTTFLTRDTPKFHIRTYKYFRK